MRLYINLKILLIIDYVQGRIQSSSNKNGKKTQTFSFKGMRDRYEGK
jgi:hypothetical protein